MKFSQLTREKLKYYVYRLTCPINGDVFYIGKGKGNRVFDHVNDALKSSDRTDKLDYIRGIIDEEEEVIHEIVRHGMDEETAFEVEGALIDAYGLEELKNDQNGHKNNQCGICSDKELEFRYGATPVIIDDPVFLGWALHFIPDKTTPEELYEDTRSSWLVKPQRHKEAKYALSIYGMTIREVYEIDKWDFVPITQGKAKKKKDRYEFVGPIASEEIRKKYIGRDISSYIVKEQISKKTGKLIKIVNQNLKWVNC